MRICKIAALLLAVSLTLIGCTNREEETAEATQQTESPESEPFKLMEDGKAVAALVYPEYTRFEDFNSYIEEAKLVLSRAVGSVIPCISDTDTRLSDYEYQVLLGDTAIAESTDAYKSLGMGGYTVASSNKKLVVIGQSEKEMKLAVDVLKDATEKGLQKQGKDISLSVENVKVIGKEIPAAFSVLGIDISECILRYPHGNTELKGVAVNFGIAIGEAYGVRPAVMSDKAAATDRDIVLKFDTQSTDVGEYRITVKKGKLTFAGFGASALEYSADEFIAKLTSENITDIKEDFTMSGKLSLSLEADMHQKLTAGADVRVMSANLQSQEWDGGEVSPRAEIFYANLMFYTPDVIGVQEVSKAWKTELKKVIEKSDYKILHETLEGREYNYCPLIYNSDRLTVIESKSYFLGPDYPRSVTWAVFEVKTSGERFAVLNTHLDWTHLPVGSTETGSNTPSSREAQVRTIVGTVKSIEEKYNVPIMLTADWNTLQDKHPLNILTEETGVVYSNEVAEICKWPSNDVDYIFVSADTRCLLSYLYKNNVMQASDHRWGFADFKL